MKKLSEMSEKELNALCRYYHGEDRSPYEGKDQNKNLLWFYERSWVLLIINGNMETIEEYLAEYIGKGLIDFRSNDLIPIHLKALLCNRYMRGSMDGNIEPFMVFYKKYY